VNIVPSRSSVKARGADGFYDANYIAKLKQSLARSYIWRHSQAIGFESTASWDKIDL
jgi:hypothetical protein